MLLLLHRGSFMDLGGLLLIRIILQIEVLGTVVVALSELLQMGVGYRIVVICNERKVVRVLQGPIEQWKTCVVEASGIGRVLPPIS